MRNTIAAIGIILSLLQVVPYWREALRGKARPNIVSWFSWTLLTLIASSAALAGGNWQVGAVVLANALATGSVVLLGVWKGYARMTGFDAVCQAMALAGLATWPLLHTPVVAVAATVIIDGIALLPTLRHAYTKPQEETWLTYALAASGSLCALLAASSYAFTIIGYAAYLVVADGLVALTILLRQRRNR